MDESDERIRYLKNATLKDLYLSFIELTKWLHLSPISHGDLKHDNIIVNEFGHLKLIDYDGMFVPALVGLKAAELGSPCYQHPARNTYFFNSRMDEFSIVVILTTLYILSVKSSFFKDHYDGDGILFSEVDLKELKSSQKFSDLIKLDNKELKKLLALLTSFKDINSCPDFGDIFANTELKGWSKQKSEQKYNTLIILEHLLRRYRKWIENAEKLFDTSKSDLNINYNDTLRIYDQIQFHPPSLVYSLPKTTKVNCNWEGVFSTKQITVNYHFVNIYSNWLDWDAISSFSNITEDVLEVYQQKVNWEALSWNEYLNWNKSLIDRYFEYWDWKKLSINNGIHWNLELIEFYEDKLDWEGLSKNLSLAFSFELIDRYKDKWDWSELAGNYSLPWNFELIDRYKDKWDWNWLSSNPELPWSVELINKYEDRLVFYYLSYNESIPWNLDLVSRYENNLDWDFFSQSLGLTASLELIDQYKDKWNWSALSRNKELPWSLNFIDKYKDRWNWGGSSFEGYYNGGLSANEAIPWSLSLIDKYIGKWNWEELSRNKGISWNIELIDKYKDKLIWGSLPGMIGFPPYMVNVGISQNENLRWSLELFDKYIYNWDWELISKNKGIPWSYELIEKYSSQWYDYILIDWEVVGRKNYWGCLSENEDLPWTVELIDRYQDKWSWHRLSLNIALPWSKEFIKKFESLWDFKCLQKNRRAKKYIDNIIDKE